MGIFVPEEIEDEVRVRLHLVYVLYSRWEVSMGAQKDEVTMGRFDVSTALEAVHDAPLPNPIVLRLFQEIKEPICLYVCQRY